MTTSDQIVYSAGSSTVYHVTTDCQNCPEDHREVALSVLNGTYDPCGLCATDENRRQANRNDFECTECGHVKLVGSTGSRVKRACIVCNDFTAWERV